MIPVRRRKSESGFVLLFVFVVAAILAVMLYSQLPRAAFESQRIKEDLLIERGEQYKRAIRLFVRKINKYPVSIEQLENTNNVRFLRRRYLDPMTGKDEWRLIHVGPNMIFTDSLTKKRPQARTEKDKQAGLSPIGAPAETGPPADTTPVLSVVGRRGAADSSRMPGGGSEPQQDTNEQAEAQPAFETPPGYAPPPPPATGTQAGQPDSGAQAQAGFAGQPDDPNAQPGAVPGEVPGQSAAVQGPGGLQPGFTGQPGQPGSQQRGFQVQPGQPGFQPGAAIQPGRPGFPGFRPPMGQPGMQPGSQAQPGFQPAPQDPSDAGQDTSQPAPQPAYGQGNAYNPGSAVLGPRGGAANSPFQTPMINPMAGRDPQTGLPNNNAGSRAVDDSLRNPPGRFPGFPGNVNVGGGIAGVASKARADAIKIYKDRTKYNEWEFIYDPREDPLRSPIPGTGAAPPPGPRSLGSQN